MLHSITIIIPTTEKGYDMTIESSFIPQIGSTITLNDDLEGIIVEAVEYNFLSNRVFISTESLTYKEAEKDLIAAGFKVI